jgi:aminopeptidase
MVDQRIQKLANVIVEYSLAVKPGEKMLIHSPTLAEELVLEVYKRALQAGAYIDIIGVFPRANETFYRYASGEQFDTLSPGMQIYASYDKILSIFADQNTRALSGVDPELRARRLKANNTYFALMGEKEERGEWCSTLFPASANAQDSRMSLEEYEDYVYHAGKLDTVDPVAGWRTFAAQMNQLSGWLDGHDQVVMKGKDVDLRLSAKGRRWFAADGKANFPDGEIFTSPVENSASGWVRFSYPALVMGRDVEGMELWFEEGRVVKLTANRGEDAALSLINTDEGARYLGELAVGTNYSVMRQTRHMLIDEKMGGTFHIALGESFPQIGGKNKSGLHWDILFDMKESEVTVDGEPFYRDGKPVLWTDEMIRG